MKDTRGQSSVTAFSPVAGVPLENPPGLTKTRRQPSRGWAWPRFRELWEYRELLYFFAWRDIKVRYKQTVMGALWAIIQPFFTIGDFQPVFWPSGQYPF
jgi:lipopolysaccharide transport system permease protein